ncbi:hypothetical protein P7C71_g1816, partial [Lecanoromycetidae sp. Uapishka_2]
MLLHTLKYLSLAASLLSSAYFVNSAPQLEPRQIPANATDVTTIQSPTGVTIRYKEPGKEGVCETTPGVGSYAGYVDLAPDSHTFFWFFEARHNPESAPLTLWLNGGPGSDSLIGLFQGVGFSYSEEEAGSMNPFTGEQENSTYGITGEWPVINATELSTTDLAAVATWHVLQGFLSALPQLDGKVANKTFNLWTESYGGHYGPSFYNYFYDQNELIANGSANGTQLIFDTLGIGNGIISESIQAPYYPEFAVNNTYGIKAVNDTVYEYMKFAYYMIGGCGDLCAQCEQNALGVNLNYTDANEDVYYAFQKSGDFSYPNFLSDLEMILNNSVRVAMYHGDADYICNWFGGQAVSLAVNYTHSAEFRAAGYEPFIVDGTEYGEVRQYGNFSFLRMYEAGHEVPFYQPAASLAMFQRVLDNIDLATGEEVVTGTLVTNGTANATHTEPYVAIPSVTGTGVEPSYTAAITNPITSVPVESVAAVSSGSASMTTTDGVYGRFVRKDIKLE